LVNGNTQGIRAALLDELDKLYDADMELLRHEIISQPVMDVLADMTGRINREISVYVARDGMVMDVSIGSHDRVSLPELKVRRGARRLSGIRCIHTHPDGNPYLSSVDERTLRRMRFDAMISVGCSDGQVTGIHVGMLTSLDDKGEYTLQNHGPYRPSQIPHELLLDDIRYNEETISRSAQVLAGQAQAEERAILLAVDTDGRGESSIEELERLADTAGAVVLHKELQKRPAIDSTAYVGKGKLQELALIRQSLDANLIICDDEITGAQARNLEHEIGCRVIDRTQLILDIFARRATTHEGKLQVELAQYKYLLPRLAGQGSALSRLGGGIGTRGPGESKLETDRRYIRRRIRDLENEVEELQKHRQVMRRSRRRNQVPVIALVGYTNSGKSTLLNTLSGLEDAFAEDKLFATLDPLTRHIQLPGGTEALLVDTVGFIHKLPHDLIDAFRSTLEEALYADLLVHVVDASSSDCRQQYEVAEGVLNSLGAGQKKKLVAFNKMDREPGNAHFLPEQAPWADISALHHIGLNILCEKMEEELAEQIKPVDLVIPYDQGKLMGELHEQCKVISQSYEEDGIHIQVLLSQDMAQYVKGKLMKEKK